MIFQGRLVHAPGSEEAGNLVEYTSCLLLIDLHRYTVCQLRVSAHTANPQSQPPFPRPFPEPFPMTAQ